MDGDPREPLAPPEDGGRVARLLDAVLPYRRLTPRGWARWKHRHQQLRSWDKVNACALYFAFLLGWLLLAAAIAYVVLYISALTPVTGQFLEPKIGKHWHWVVAAKQLIVALCIHFLCSSVLRPDHDTREQRFGTAGQELNTPGVGLAVAKLLYRVRCKPWREQWLSTFTVDYVLLVFVGVFYQVMQPCFVAIELWDGDNPDPIGVLVRAICSCYAGALVLGFVLTTLHEHCLAKPGRGPAFLFAMLLLITLWLVEFFVVTALRQMTTQFYYNAGSFERIVASLGQIYVTHSLVLLGAVLLGHSGHFQKSPDLMWRTALTKGLAFALAALGVFWLFENFRKTHEWPECKSGYSLAVLYKEGQAWLTVLGGPVLLLCALKASFDHRLELQVGTSVGSLAAKLFDYDAFVVTLTYCAAIWYNLCEVYKFNGQLEHPENGGDPTSRSMFIVSILEAAGPLGLAVFTLVVWSNVRGPVACAWQRAAVWFALFFAVSGFVHFEGLEDCETSSALPECCNVPRGIVRDSEESEKMCAIDRRCATRPHYANGTLGEWCALAEEDDATVASAADASCPDIRERWSAFTECSDDHCPLAVETFEEEAKESNAFQIFKAVGGAGAVEFYFAVTGILMKVIFQCEHEHSAEILASAHHGHHEAEMTPAHHAH